MNEVMMSKSSGGVRILWGWKWICWLDGLKSGLVIPMCDNRHCSLVIIHLLFHSQRNPMPLWHLPSWFFVHHSQWLLLLRTLCLVFIYLERTQPHTNTRLIEARDHQPLDGSLIQETPPRRRHLGCGAKADPATSRMSLQITVDRLYHS